jgi:hypothetical protein
MRYSIKLCTPQKRGLLDGTATVSKSLDPTGLLDVFFSTAKPEQVSDLSPLQLPLSLTC